MEFLGVKSSRHSTDGHWVSIAFDTDEGALETASNTQTMATIAQELSAIVWEAKKANRDAYVLSVPQAAKAQVQPTKSRDGVVVRFQMPNNLEHLFALDPSQAKALRDQLSAALDALG